jgi:tetratricopeptide (TPR) repeat protein/lambda repressor-like predicted transcriptional regulator
VGGLPRPELPPGAQRHLVDALHALHHEAGWPSLRAMARKAGCSHTTISTVFSSPRLPAWGMLELVVEAMGGDVGEFHRLWLAASGPAAPAQAAARIAGRPSELVALRRHLESGSGLLLVAGEAGIGKSRLAETAVSQATDVFVARGACLPLSAQVPLLPVIDALRHLFEADGGQRFKEALADCPLYVDTALRRLLPELDDLVPAPPVPEDEWWRQRLFSAFGAVLSALAGARPTAVLLEDLHWADSTTLDLVEHLLSRPPPFPLVATYRQGDPSTSSATDDWLGRIQRLRAVTTIALEPLTRDECAEQLTLLGLSVTPSEADRIYQRSAGLPLFIEQLAQSADDASLTGPLADLLDRRLAGMSPDEWVIARALGIADRPLTAAELRAQTDLTPDALTAGLRALDGRHLTRTGEHDVRLRHPLLAEGVRRLLVAGEASAEHRRLALTLAEGQDPSAAEIAEHWRRADEPTQEIVWRIRAARDARYRFAAGQEAQQWQRALVLWPDDADIVGTPGVRKADAYVGALEALEHIDWPAASAVADKALTSLTEPQDPATAEVYRRAGVIRGNLGDPAAGLALVDRALDILDADRHPAERARALLNREYLLSGLDRLDEAAAACFLASELAAGDPVTARAALVGRAVHAAESCRFEEALEHIRAAASVETPEANPGGDLYVALTHTHILLTAGCGADEVVAAGRPGLEAATTWGIDDFRTAVLQGNLSEALRRAGRVQEAARLIDPVTEEPPTPHRWPTYSERGLLDLLRGRSDEATKLLDAVAKMFVMDVANRVLCAQDAPTADLWCNRPQRAYDRLTATLRDLGETEDQAVDVASLLVLAARAAADLAAAPTAAVRLRTTLLRELDDLAATTVGDPFATPNVNANRPALRATWDAEIGRLSGTSSLELWAAAAGAWDKIGRPHDSAYCRWRGAEVALRTGQASAALKLLRRAERDAREHMPLLDRIRRATTVTPATA